MSFSERYHSATLAVQAVIKCCNYCHGQFVGIKYIQLCYLDFEHMIINLESQSH